MKYLYSPVFDDVKKITYSFDGEEEIVDVVFENGTETFHDSFDFSVLEDEGDQISESETLGQLAIETELPIQPFQYVRRVNGQIEIKTLYFYNSENVDNSIKFPEWMEV